MSHGPRPAVRPPGGPGALRKVFIALLALAAGGPVAAQVIPTPPVEFVGASDLAVDQRLSDLLERDPLIIIRDTMVGPADTVRQAVLVLDATLVLEGTLLDDLVLVDAGAFVRPGAVVRGDLVNAGGGVYRSELARVGGTFIDLPNAGYRVVREEDRIVIEASGVPSPLTLDGIQGFHEPTYDRVNGVTGVWGATLRLPRLGNVTPRIHGEAGWRTERGEPVYAASLGLRWAATTLEGGYEEGWATNDDWIRDDFANSINYLWDGDDFRDYHEVERRWAAVVQAFGDEEKSFYGRLRVGGQIEDARSLPGGNPWNVMGDTARSNPDIDEGRTTSLLTRFALDWTGRRTVFDGWVEYEAAREWEGGAFAFDRIAVHGDWAMLALANHTLEIEFFGQLPLGGDTLPRQRWSFVGGSGTLQTLDLAQHYGDRVAWVENRYIIPLPERLALPLLGAPDLQLIHATGMAWLADDDRSLVQEVGVRLQFFGVYLRYMVRPEDLADGQLDISVTWPFGDSYPWES
ncbi:MAG: hypothetical protein GWM90_22705 [Gemmatimonadetes bacterium]|nr:hypothetical protein [Gemmatimonadota bacterium]NIQ57436.1 hypothetical protein [Gemmatimonadota bacterium]NIU79119.1 hypothetical protein [Gammaproteobacteria bacterium]NIX46787.1 hypothetical protein [Gemmatimonadota bacterium]NIY11141.1 hypothetical protein [Gemmatimonadota bacterium]